MVTTSDRLGETVKVADFLKDLPLEFLFPSRFMFNLVLLGVFLVTSSNSKNTKALQI